jgi:hypothetical protein
MLKELVQIVKARNWALASFNSLRNPHIHINVSDYPEEYAVILNDVPQSYHNVTIPTWFSRVDTINDMNYVIYDKDIVDGDIEPQNLYIYQFKHNDQIYYGLYDEHGKRVSDRCLILFDRNMTYENQGYAPGRCPDVIEQIEV